MGRESMKAKLLSLAVKYWCRVSIVRVHYGQQKGNMKFSSWAKNVYGGVTENWIGVYLALPWWEK
jgi:hypothetical protein